MGILDKPARQLVAEPGRRQLHRLLCAAEVVSGTPYLRLLEQFERSAAGTAAQTLQSAGIYGRAAITRQLGVYDRADRIVRGAYTDAQKLLEQPPAPTPAGSARMVDRGAEVPAIPGRRRRGEVPARRRTICRLGRGSACRASVNLEAPVSDKLRWMRCAVGASGSWTPSSAACGRSTISHQARCASLTRRRLADVQASREWIERTYPVAERRR
jgi:hypothetical protein